VQAVKRRYLWLGVKLVVAGVLVGLLLVSGKLDFDALSLFVDRPALLAANLAVFVASTLLGALRWRLLLRLADVRISVSRAIQLHLTAVFFNVALPGNIGGDVVKSVYVARDAAPGRRTSVFVIAFVDRLLALVGLVVVAAVLTAVRGRASWEGTRIRELTTAIAVLMLATVVAPAIALVVIQKAGARLEGWTGGATRLARFFGQLVAAARLVSAQPRVLVTALGFAIAAHLAGIVLFAALAAAITAHDVPISTLASIYPLGMLSMVLPISYAGFGVGHVAFEQLFAMIGLTSGATVLNVYLIGQTLPCLAGVVPYLRLRRELAPSLAEAR
jgi:uncharacterized protein (TIRG00374 family)